MPSEQVGLTLVGTWDLGSCEIRRSDDNVAYPFGADAVGRIAYDGAGRMAVHLMRRDRPDFASGDMLRGTPQEIEAAWSGYLGYAGTYVVDEPAGTVTHRITISSFPNWVGDDQVRFFRLEGDTLELTTAPLTYGGVSVVVALVWVRD